MTRLLTALLLALAASPVLANEPPVYADPPATPVEVQAAPAPARSADPKASTVYVRRDLGGGASACGTGTVIAAEDGRSLILTNAHVVEDGNRPVEVIHESEGRPWSYKARYVAGSRVVPTGPGSIDVQGPDLCLLVIDWELPAVEIADEMPAPGSRVCQFGFGGRLPGHPPTEKSGVVLAPRTSSPCLNTTIPSQSGDSGSGIFDVAGQLVGVCWGGSECQYAVRLDAVHTFTVSVLERKGLFARFRARLAARKIAREMAEAAVGKGTVGGLLPACPAGGCPGGCGCAGNGAGKSCPKDCPAARPPALAPAVPSGPFGGCPNGRCPNQAPVRGRR